MTQKQETKKFCGNCRHHDTYEYPDLIFCFGRFEQRKNAIFSILDHCEDWELQSQGCCCLKDALKKQEQEKKW